MITEIRQSREMYATEKIEHKVEITESLAENMRLGYRRLPESSRPT